MSAKMNNLHPHTFQSFPPHIAVNDMVFDVQRDACLIATSSGLWRWSPGQVLTCISSKRSGFQDGVGRTAQFNNPHCLAIDPQDSSVWIADTGNRRIRRLQGDQVETIAGNGGWPPDIKNAVSALNASFSWPEFLAVSSKGSVFVIDRYDRADRDTCMYLCILIRNHARTDTNVYSVTTVNLTFAFLRGMCIRPQTNHLYVLAASSKTSGYQIYHLHTQRQRRRLSCAELMVHSSMINELSTTTTLDVLPDGSIYTLWYGSRLCIFNPATEQQFVYQSSTVDDSSASIGWKHVAIDARRRRLYVVSSLSLGDGSPHTSFRDGTTQTSFTIHCMNNLSKEWFEPSPYVLVNWRRVSVLIAFLRANSGHSFQTSILTLVCSIVSLLPF